MTVAQRLADLGVTLPEVPAPVAAYVPAVRTGSMIYTSGQLPFAEGALMATGLVGAEVSVETAVACARQCALNALAAVASQAGGLESVRILKVVGFVASAPGFTAQPQVVNGASELIGEVLADRGVHARSAVGVALLPLGAPVEVEVIAEVL
jgi:enamine deaminase RidA (YjgF/YER057c/UK114 family)